MNKLFNKYSLILGVAASLFLQQLSYAHASYIPRDLKQCVHAAARCVGKAKAMHLQELDAMINEGRILISESVMRKALNEALGIFENSNSIAYENMSVYVEEYLEGLNNRAIVLSLQGENQYLSLMPMGLIVDAVNAHAKDIDMMRISTEVATRQNIDVSGMANVQLGELDLFDDSAVAGNRASLAFNAAMMSNAVSSTPNMIFGTGVASPSINAWIMSPSGVTRLPAPQSPINLQFMIPVDYEKKKPVSLELAFLVSLTQLITFNGIKESLYRLIDNRENNKFGLTRVIEVHHNQTSNRIFTDKGNVSLAKNANDLKKMIALQKAFYISDIEEKNSIQYGAIICKEDLNRPASQIEQDILLTTNFFLFWLIDQHSTKSKKSADKKKEELESSKAEMLAEAVEELKSIS